MMNKKNVLESIVQLLKDEPAELTKEQVLREVQNELDKMNGETEARHQARAQFVGQARAKIIEVMKQTNTPMTAIQIFKSVPDWGIEDFTSRKITNLFMREMADEIRVVASDGLRKTYELKS